MGAAEVSMLDSLHWEQWVLQSLEIAAHDNQAS